jgi:hypothetical protein
MILTIISLVTIFQLCLYLALDSKGYRQGKGIVFGLIILANFVVFPTIMIQQIEFEPGDVRCGMPALGITLAFLIFGNVIALMTHLIYVCLMRILDKY